MGEQLPEGFKQQWSRLLAADIKVVAIRDTPWLGFDVPGMYSKSMEDFSLVQQAKG
jgi:hypothetical protein